MKLPVKVAPACSSMMSPALAWFRAACRSSPALTLMTCPPTGGAYVVSRNAWGSWGRRWAKTEDGATTVASNAQIAAANGALRRRRDTVQLNMALRSRTIDRGAPWGCLLNRQGSAHVPKPRRGGKPDARNHRRLDVSVMPQEIGGFRATLARYWARWKGCFDGSGVKGSFTGRRELT